MQRLDLELDHFTLFCPATGQQILFEDDFVPSPAQKFCYVEGYFEYADDETKGILKSIGLTIDDDNYLDWDDFERFLKELDGYNNYVLFELTYSGMACGPVSMTAYHCINMNFPYDEDVIKC
jgi:hypothetical protein